METSAGRPESTSPTARKFFSALMVRSGAGTPATEAADADTFHDGDELRGVAPLARGDQQGVAPLARGDQQGQRAATWTDEKRLTARLERRGVYGAAAVASKAVEAARPSEPRSAWTTPRGPRAAAGPRPLL
jgi:hypothetical protein